MEWKPPSTLGGSNRGVYTVQLAIGIKKRYDNALIYLLILYCTGGYTWEDYANTTETRLLVSQLVFGLSYYFRVKASNEAGSGPFSNNATSRYGSVSQAPFAPVLIDLSLGKSFSSVSFNFTRPSDAQTAGHTYTIEYSMIESEYATFYY